MIFGIYYKTYLMYVGETKQNLKNRIKQIKNNKRDGKTNLNILFDYFEEKDLIFKHLEDKKSLTKIRFMKYKKYKLRYKLYNNFLNSIKE